MAARTVCGSQPSRWPISATEAPSGRSSIAISLARFVLADGASALLTLPAPKSVRAEVGLERERAGARLS
jgi:hypothetical protein